MSDAAKGLRKSDILTLLAETTGRMRERNHLPLSKQFLWTHFPSPQFLQIVPSLGIRPRQHVGRVAHPADQFSHRAQTCLLGWSRQLAVSFLACAASRAVSGLMASQSSRHQSVVTRLYHCRRRRYVSHHRGMQFHPSGCRTGWQHLNQRHMSHRDRV